MPGLAFNPVTVAEGNSEHVFSRRYEPDGSVITVPVQGHRFFGPYANSITKMHLTWPGSAGLPPVRGLPRCFEHGKSVKYTNGVVDVFTCPFLA